MCFLARIKAATKLKAHISVRHCMQLWRLQRARAQVPQAGTPCHVHHADVLPAHALLWSN